MIYKEDLETIKILCLDANKFNLSFHIDYLLMDKIWKIYSEYCHANFLNYNSDNDKLILLKAINHYIKMNEEDMEIQHYLYKLKNLKHIDKLCADYLDDLQELYNLNLLFEDFTMTLEFLFEVIYEYYLYCEIQEEICSYLKKISKKDIILAVSLYKFKYPQEFIPFYE